MRIYGHMRYYTKSYGWLNIRLNPDSFAILNNLGLRYIAKTAGAAGELIAVVYTGIPLGSLAVNVVGNLISVTIPLSMVSTPTLSASSLATFLNGQTSVTNLVSLVVTSGSTLQDSFIQTNLKL